MSQLAVNHNGVAGKAAGWSARHRRKAIFGRLLFVVGAYLIGMAVRATQPHRHPDGKRRVGTGDADLREGLPVPLR